MKNQKPIANYKALVEGMVELYRDGTGEVPRLRRCRRPRCGLRVKRGASASGCARGGTWLWLFVVRGLFGVVNEAVYFCFLG